MARPAYFGILAFVKTRTRDLWLMRAKLTLHPILFLVLVENRVENRLNSDDVNLILAPINIAIRRLIVRLIVVRDDISRLFALV